MLRPLAYSLHTTHQNSGESWQHRDAKYYIKYLLEQKKTINYYNQYNCDKCPINGLIQLENDDSVEIEYRDSTAFGDFCYDVCIIDSNKKVKR